MFDFWGIGGCLDFLGLGVRVGGGFVWLVCCFVLYISRFVFF